MGMYKIISRQDLTGGMYDGATPAEALETRAIDAGYDSHAESCAETGDSPSDWTTDLHTFRRGSVGLLVQEVTWTLYDRIGRTPIDPGEVVKYGWAEGSAVYDGGEPDSVETVGEMGAAEIAAEVLPYADEPSAAGVRGVHRPHRGFLVAWDDTNKAWWLTGIQAV